MYCALPPGHSQILSHSCGEIDLSPRLRDKIWEWPGNKATVQHVLIEVAYVLPSIFPPVVVHDADDPTQQNNNDDQHASDYKHSRKYQAWSNEDKLHCHSIVICIQHQLAIVF